jgi:hypothetical protein
MEQKKICLKFNANIISKFISEETKILQNMQKLLFP